MPVTYLKKLSKIRPENYFIQLENAKRMFPKIDPTYNKIQQDYLVRLISQFIKKEKIFIN